MPLSISVIIPTYNRKKSLRRTLDSLSRQSYPVKDFEVIVVDDGGNDGTDAITQQTYPYALHYIRQENQGEIVARNTGADRSTGKLLVFLDDDIEVNPDYLAMLAAAHKKHGQAVVLGTLVEILANAKGLTLHTIQETHHARSSDAEAESVTFIDCMSGIISISRCEFFEIGAMQPLRSGEGRNIWGGIDIGYRAHQHRLGFWRAPNAIALHHDSALASLGTRCQRNYRVSYAVQDLFAKYPALQGQIPMFRDKEPVAWRQDPFPLIIQKLARQSASSQVVMRGLEAATPVVERYAPTSKMLVRLYRWVISGYIFRGYQEGLMQHRHEVKA